MFLKLIFLFTLQIFCVYGLKEITIYEEQTDTLKCDDPHNALFIYEVSWSYDMVDIRNYFMPAGYRNLAFFWGKLLNFCVYDELTKVRNMCHGKSNCTITANRDNFSSACKYWMELKISYDCHPCKDRYKRQLEALKNVLYVDYICDFREPLPSHEIFIECPNKRFEAKHVCKTCRDDELGAALFAYKIDETMRKRGLTSQASVQSVFIIPHGRMTYNEIGNYCIFNSIAPKYDCRPDATGWDCVKKGFVFAYHDKYTGHYEPSMDNHAGFITN